MIEKILRRFVSEETEFVLKAMEQVGADPELSHKYGIAQKYDEMTDAALDATARRVDRLVIVAVRARLKKERCRVAKRTQARNIAVQIMLGETFEEEAKNKAAKNPAGLGGLAGGLMGNALGQQNTLTQGMAQQYQNQIMHLAAHAQMQAGQWVKLP